jgi:hypothetical protein
LNLDGLDLIERDAAVTERKVIAMKSDRFVGNFDELVVVESARKWEDKEKRRGVKWFRWLK